MKDVVLHDDDCIETVLPIIGEAMENGEICRISNIERLGLRSIAALVRLTSSSGFFDVKSGKVLRPNPGFGLVGVDEFGAVWALG
ncbi:hypothetical protein [Propionivibrio dicarboxylicus]|uniref:Uncharacterized protein n=1 Tax=Propionivibrio dicarboxylicus TaxID=83767 RepID=A0A1G8GBT8_9RHOO|nr:hypothetical protein [Propionivibrio dicarboxylicus]SDH91892.1 hypothetical protein SAMN05660652_02534 [Propionivibrio dicarboxylicus]